MPDITASAISRQETKELVDAALKELFHERLNLARPLGDSYVRLWETMAGFSLAGGKRLRPYMVLLGYQTFGGKTTSDILPVAVAWELLHLCMLVHDDIIDNDLIRYGVDNIAGSYEHIYQPLENDQARRSHLASSAAILAGDLAHSTAHEIILASNLAPEQKILAQRYLTAATFAVAGGELLDTESVLYPMQDVDALNIAQFKTASYSFVGPLCTGAALAGAAKDELDQLQEFGIALGCAFQLTDDLLGLFGDPAITGKSTIGDIREKKRTYVMQQAFQKATAADMAKLTKLMGPSDINNDDADVIKAIVRRSGAPEATEKLIDSYVSACQDSLRQLAKTQAGAEHLEPLITIAIKRSY